jgi:hypothetical protein
MLKRLLDRFRGWREKRASLQYLADVESRMLFEYAKFQLRDLKRKEELRKLWKKIHKRNGQREYVV